MRTGGCQCGAVRFEVAGEPLGLYICHCLECRKQSASAFGMSLRVPRAGFALRSGTPRSWTRPTDSGRSLTCWFCTHCGSRLWHERSATAPTITIKGGALDEPPDVAQAVHIWTARKMPGLRIPEEAEQYPREPPG